VIGAPALILALFAWMWYGALRAAPAPPQRLPDGSLVRLEAVTYGRRHQFRQCFFLWGWLHDRVPWLQGLIKVPDASGFPTSTDILVAWLSRRAPSGAPSAPLESGYCEILDAHGCPYGTAGVSFDGKNSFVIAQSFPRREPSFTLRVYGQDLSGSADLQVPNPLYGRGTSAAWRPSPLPLTRTSGGCAFTLQRLTSWRFAPIPRRSVGRLETTASFRVTRNGRPEAGWEASAVTLRDGAGNAIDGSYAYRDGVPQAGYYYGSATAEAVAMPGLCPYEPAWKLRVTFYRTQDARFGPEESASVANLAIPAPGTVRRLAARLKLGRATVELRAFGGAGKVVYLGGMSHAPLRAVRLRTPAGSLQEGYGSEARAGGIPVDETVITSNKPHLAVLVRGLKPGEQLTLQAADNRGRRVEVGNGGSFAEPGNSIRFISLAVLPGAREVRLTVARQQARVVEFLVRPPASRPGPDLDALARRDFPKAAAALTAYLQVRPNDGTACNNLAWVYAAGPPAVRSPQKALPLALRAVEREPENADALNTLGVVYYRLGEWKKAADLFEGLIRDYPEGGNAFNYYFLAMSYARLGRPAQARNAYAQALRWVRKQPVLSETWRIELEQFRKEAAAVLGIS
jgi:hypothetical protein